jgi:hypothetical protein
MSLRLKNLVRAISLLIIAFAMTACVTSPIPTSLIFGNVKGTMQVFPDKIGSKMGKTCYTIFGLYIYPVFLIGDASVKTAADNGGITKISLVDYEQESIFFNTYARTCIVVYGE